MKRLAWLALPVGLMLLTGLVAFYGPWHAAHLILLALQVITAVATAAGIGYTLLASALLPRFFARPTAAPTSYPPVTVVKPLHGDEWNLLSNLKTFCDQDYPGEVQYLFGVHDSTDPAVKVVEALRALHPQANIGIVADTRLYGPNRKISNIVNMMPQVLHDVMVFADSDVSVKPDYLRNLVGELQKPGVGLVTCIYTGNSAPGFWPRLAVNAINYHFVPGVVTGLSLGLARPCLGPTIAMRRSTLDKIGGFEQFAHHLAEDHAIGEAVRRTGETVAIPAFSISHACAETSPIRLFKHELRWSRTIRSIDPAGHLGSSLMHPFAIALLTVALSGGARWSVGLALAALLARIGLKLSADRELGHSHRGLWLVPIWDIASFVVFLASYASTRVIWRGFTFKVDGNGMLRPVQDE
ncbi:MAG: bacteriohopanetetrol glucosamine biosynthesis glycosyltransferase HpnI [Paraburkholderia sp.]|nr:bacteriohopanetetrol glucosamine biosynthesis glycosyltransferase HpnI [Paraburkholderia sp.]